MEGLLSGSFVNANLIKFLSSSLNLGLSGKTKWPFFIFLYVFLTSEVANGAFPIDIVYVKTPSDQISALKPCSLFPSKNSGAK